MAATGYNGVFPQLGATDTMLLYHFLSAKYGLEAIKNRRLKVALLMELNDPFEFLGLDLSDKTLRGAMERTKTNIGSKRGILCFSKTWTNPMLWGHYADKHKGICLGLEVPERDIDKINYEDERLKVPRDIDDIDFEFMRELIRTKFRHWEYEEEYRLWVPLNNKINNLYYAAFADVSIKLTRVIIGSRSDVTRTQVTDALGDLARDVKRFKSRPSFKKFQVVRNMNKSLWR